MAWPAFADHLIGLGLAARTVTYYVRHSKGADEWLRLRGSSLAAANASLVAEYAAVMLTNSHSTRGQAAAAFAHYWQWIDRPRPPLKALRVPPAPLMVCRALEPAEASALHLAAKDWWPEGAAVMLGLYLALRREEIACAQWERFDPPMEWYRVTGKRSKTAVLPVHPFLRSQLEKRRQPTGWIFPGRFGGPLAPATVWQWIRMVAVEADIPYLTTHQLRHTSLATANDNLGDLRAVQTFARHDRPETTAGYTRTTSRKLIQVVDALIYDDDASGYLS